MSLKDWFRRKSEGAETTGGYPWDRHPSIYEFICAHVKPDVRGLTPSGEKLPDEPPDPNKLRFVAGGMDGVMSHHAGKTPGQAEALVKLVSAYCGAPTAANKLAVYNALKDDNVIAIIDEALEQISKTPGLDAKRLYEMAKTFAVEATDRGPVKIGVGILGRFRQKEDADVFRTLGRHEEFTLFCAVALANTCENPEKDLWDLAKQVDGWGRIHIVERLAQTADPRIQDWMLRDGFRNSIMNEYLAWTCATAGGLAGMLQSDHVDDELLTGAGEILEALISGGPAQGIDDYEDAPAALQAYINLISTRGSTLKHYLAIRAIRDYLERSGDIAATATADWSPELRQELRESCDEILNREQWRTLVERDLNSADEGELHVASSVADLIGINTWPHHWRRLNDTPTDQSRWFHVMRKCDEQHIAATMLLAQRALPLDKLASGPASEMGLGPQYQLNNCLDMIVQELRRFPGFGARLITTALRSPVIRTRNMALKAMEAWGRSSWPIEMREALGQAAAREPESAVAESMRKLLEGQPLG